MAARTLLLKIERRGELVLPARRQMPNNRMGLKPVVQPGLFPEDGALFPKEDAINVALPELLPLAEMTSLALIPAVVTSSLHVPEPWVTAELL